MVISRQPHPDAGIRVPASYLAAFVDDLRLDRNQLAELARHTGLPVGALDGQASTLALDEVLSALRWIDARAMPGWHILPTLGLEAAHHGPLGVAVVTAASVDEALDTLVQFETTRAPWTLLRRCRNANRLCIQVTPIVELHPPGGLLMEINLIALIGLIAQLLGRHEDALESVFPAGYRPWESRLRQHLPGALRFAGQHHRISLPESLLHRPCLMADQGLHESAVARCESLLTNQDRHGPLAARVRQRLVELEGRSPGMESMARGLGLSPRSLIRQLGAQGTSYREQLDQVRQTLARDLLLNSDLTVSDIAERLGYADPANFGRAFRRWFRHSPGQLRIRRRLVDSG